MKKCSFCGNANFKSSKIDYTYKHNGAYLIINNVPCSQCEFCGEQYFKSTILKQIEKEFDSITTGKKDIVEHITVPLESFENLSY